MPDDGEVPEPRLFPSVDDDTRDLGKSSSVPREVEGEVYFWPALELQRRINNAKRDIINRNTAKNIARLMWSEWCKFIKTKQLTSGITDCDDCGNPLPCPRDFGSQCAGML